MIKIYINLEEILFSFKKINLTKMDAM